MYTTKGPTSQHPLTPIQSSPTTGAQKGSKRDTLKVALISTYKVDMAAALEHLVGSQGIRTSHDDMTPAARASSLLLQIWHEEGSEHVIVRRAMMGHPTKGGILLKVYGSVTV